MLDDYCNDPGSDLYNGLGCNACGIQNCRVCGIDGYIDCYPSISSQNPSTVELSLVENNPILIGLPTMADGSCFEQGGVPNRKDF